MTSLEETLDFLASKRGQEALDYLKKRQERKEKLPKTISAPVKSKKRYKVKNNEKKIYDEFD